MDAGARPATDAANEAVTQPARDAASSDAAVITPPADAATGQDAASWPTLDAAQIAAPKRVAGGYGLAESPLWDPCGHRLLFPDVNASVIHQLGSEGKVSTFMTNTNYANGLAFEPDGSLVMAQMGGGRGGRVVRRRQDGTVSVLVDRNPRGQLFYTVDDLVVRSDGTIYFTDGDFPHGPYGGFTLLGELALYILKPGNGPRVLVEGHTVRGPNGVELSPDEKTLYLSSYFSEQIVKLKVAGDGSLSAPAVFARSLTNSDSFCLDAAGNVYAAVSAGLQVIRADGTRVKLIPVTSADGATNCGFGGEDGKTLYITAWTDLWKVEDMPIPGLDWLKHRDMPCAAPSSAP
jgi:gluconolactonase